MSDSELVSQRRANYEELLALGIRPYPNAFDATHRVADLVATYGSHSGEALDAEHVPVRAAGRILGMRTFGKANFLVLSDGVATLQVYIRQDSVLPSATLRCSSCSTSATRWASTAGCSARAPTS